MLIERLLKLRQDAVEQDPENIGKQLRLLIALARCGRITEANAVGREVRDQIDPTDALNYDLACAYAQIGRGKTRSG